MTIFESTVESSGHRPSRSCADGFPGSVDASRRLIVGQIGSATDAALIKPYGNRGDDLILSGTRELLKGHVYREIGIDDVCSATGELAIIGGGGGWTRSVHDYMPEVLRIAERRFDRVIVLPSSFEVAADRVRDALASSNAYFFAREPESLRQIQGICNAGIAHDCAFFADLEEFRSRRAEGTLNAFRVDHESRHLIELPHDNEDISDTVESLSEWLNRISGAAVINTDRAHVMIAGALIGRRVNYVPNRYFKVKAIAESALAQHDVRPMSLPAETDRVTEKAARLSADTVLDATHEPGPVTITIFNRDRAAAALENAESLLKADGFPRIVLRNAVSDSPASRRIRSEEPTDARFRAIWADRDLAIPDTLRLAIEEANSEYLMFLTDDMRLGDDALSELVDVLDSEPECIAAAPMVVDERGAVHHCGGWTIRSASTLAIDRSNRDCSIEDVPPNVRSTGWVPTLGTLFRASAFAAVPPGGGSQFTQNIEWCSRVSDRYDDPFRAVPTAVVTADWQSEAPTGPTFRERLAVMDEVLAHADLFERTGVLCADRLGLIVPELRGTGDELDFDRTKLFLTLAGAKGATWTLTNWQDGGLGPLIGYESRHFPVDVEAHRAAQKRRERLNWLEERNAMLTGIENGGWWKLRERLKPALDMLPRRHKSKVRS